MNIFELEKFLNLVKVEFDTSGDIGEIKRISHKFGFTKFYDRFDQVDPILQVYNAMTSGDDKCSCIVARLKRIFSETFGMDRRMFEIDLHELHDNIDGVIEKLEMISSGNIDCVDLNHGLCEIIDLSVHHLDMMFKTWDKNSGSLCHPVPTVGFERATIGYWHHQKNKTLWVGEQLLYRKDLAKHMLIEIEKFGVKL